MLYLRFESDRAAPFQTLLDEHNATFKDQGVEGVGTEIAEQVDVPPHGLKLTEYPVIDKGKPTVLRDLSVVRKGEPRVTGG